MTFRPAHFTDIQRSGPPTTGNGLEWAVRLSGQPPEEWLAFFRKDADDNVSSGARWAENVRFVELRFSSSPDDLPRMVENIDQRIGRANADYRQWLSEAHRKSDERRREETTEAERVRDLNERFKNL
jgi:hypothetical protein